MTLTQPQQALLSLLEEKLESGGAAPTYREICTHMGYSSPKAAFDLVSALERKGYLKRDRRRARGLRLTSRVRGVPLLGRVTAGHPRDAEASGSEILVVALEGFGIRNRTKAFALRVTGDSMIGRQIFDGDLVLLEGDITPRHGDVVAALIDGESTLKTFTR